jgi:hypothetical protein
MPMLVSVVASCWPDMSSMIRSESQRLAESASASAVANGKCLAAAGKAHQQRRLQRRECPEAEAIGIVAAKMAGQPLDRLRISSSRSADGVVAATAGKTGAGRGDAGRAGAGRTGAVTAMLSGATVSTSKGLATGGAISAAARITCGDRVVGPDNHGRRRRHGDLGDGRRYLGNLAGAAGVIVDCVGSTTMLASERAAIGAAGSSGMAWPRTPARSRPPLASAPA